jgi:hypothetical protein
MKTLTIKKLDAFGLNDKELDLDHIYTCSVNTDKGYGIIVIDDTLKMQPGNSIGTYPSDNLTLIGLDGVLDLKIGEHEKLDLNARLLYLKTVKGPLGFWQIAVIMPT